MYTGKLETHFNEKWVKKMLRIQDPGPLAELIEERIKWPANTGPYILPSTDEKGIDIISEMVETIPDFRKKAENAIGLILWKMLHGKMDEKPELLYGAWGLIRNNNLSDCGILVHDWICKNTQYLKADNKHGVELYIYALFTFGTIQPTSDKNIETYWLGLWKDAKPQFWAAAFSGLRKQNPITAIGELPLLIKRNTSNVGAHLTAMLSDELCWPSLKHELKAGIDKDQEYCGMALNILLSKLTKPEQLKVIGQLQSHGYNPPS